MGQIALRAKSGRVEDAALALERLVPQDIVAVAPGRQRYAQFTNEDGGILDDLMVANFGDHLFLVVNAACKAEDEAHLRAQLSDDCIIEPLADRALIALQGPKAESALARFCADVSSDEVHGYRPAPTLARSTASSRARAIPARTALRFRFRPNRPRRWLQRCSTMPTCCRSGSARATACGSRPGSVFMATTSTPRRRRSKARWNGRSRRAAAHGGARAGGFPGADKILAQFEKGASRRRVGLKAEGRAPVREGAMLFADGASSEPIGKVTSGGFGPSLNAPVAMGYLPVFARCRRHHQYSPKCAGSDCRCRSRPLPFVPNTYKR